MKTQLLFLAGLLMVCVSGFCQQPPYKAVSEFEANIDLSFRDKPTKDIDTFIYSDQKKEPNGPTAYLIIQFKLLVSNSEFRIRMIQGEKSSSSKIKVGEVKKIEMGFVDALKENESQLQLILLDDKKNEISQILISIEKDGTFLMNGEKRGQF